MAKVDPKEIYQYLISKGVPQEHALGMVINIKAESNFDPSAIGDEGTSGGLFQHHNGKWGNRFADMKKFAGDDWSSNWKAQIDYALTEPDTAKYLNESFESPADASKWFTINWERPINKEQKAEERVKDFDVKELNLPKNIMKVKKGEAKSAWDIYRSKFDLPEGIDIDSEESKILIKSTIDEAITDIYNNGFGDGYTVKKGSDGRVTHVYKDGKKVKDWQGAEFLSNKIADSIADKLGFDKDDMSNAQKLTVMEYMKGAGSYLKDNVSNNERSYFAGLGLGNGGRTGMDSFVEDITQDLGFSEKFSKTPEISKGYKAPEKRLFFKDDGTPRTLESYDKEISILEKELETEKSRGPGAAGRHQRIGQLKGALKNLKNYRKEFSNYTPKVEPIKIEGIEGDIKPELKTATMPDDLIQEWSERNSVDSSLEADGGPGESNINDIELGAGNKVQIERDDSLLGRLGGLDTAVAAITAWKAGKAANKPIERPDMPELSDAFKAYMIEQEQISKMGLSPEEEAQARSTISEAYTAGMENIKRGTGGDAAKYLAMAGSLDERRQKALLDVSAMDAKLKQVNREKFAKLAMFKENFEQQRKMQMRNEEMQDIQAKYSMNQNLAAQAAKYAMESISNAKADKYQDMYMQSLTNNINAGSEVEYVQPKKWWQTGLEGLFKKGNNDNQ